MTTPLAYFARLDDDLFEATSYTMGPWDPRHQHGGPPAALLACAIDAAHPRDSVQVVRATMEILGPVPIGKLAFRSAVERSGRSVELLSGSLIDVEADREVLRASVWRIRTQDIGREAIPVSYEMPAGPDSVSDFEFPGLDEAYLTSLDMRFVRGSFFEKGPSQVWARSRVTLIDGEPMPALARVLALADSGNGVSSVLGLGKWLFINPDLTVTLRRLPVGEWVCLDAQTGIEPNGIGLAESVLSDLDGPIGRGLQTLLVGPR